MAILVVLAAWPAQYGLVSRDRAELAEALAAARATWEARGPAQYEFTITYGEDGRGAGDEVESFRVSDGRSTALMQTAEKGLAFFTAHRTVDALFDHLERLWADGRLSGASFDEAWGHPRYAEFHAAGEAQVHRYFTTSAFRAFDAEADVAEPFFLLQADGYDGDISVRAGYGGPYMEVAIWGDGTMLAEGFREDRGQWKHQRRIDAVELAELARVLDAAGFFSLERAYTSIMRDGLMWTVSHAGGYRVTVRRGQEKHSVYESYGAPDGLRRLRQALLAIGGFAQGGA